MNPSASVTLQKIKELRNISNDTIQRLEKDGVSITDIPKAQLFDNNIKNIITAIEALLRNEPSERPVMRLERDIPDAYVNIGKIKNTAAGRLNSNSLDKMKELIGFLEQTYKRL